VGPGGESGEEEALHTVLLPGETGRWCSGREVEGLVPGWAGRPVLARMLRLRRVVLVERRLERGGKLADSRALEELGLRGVRGASAGEDSLELYRLEDVPVIVKLFRARGSLGLLEALEGIIKAAV
jgi:hypothetical protein